jgi:hypothetical protein
MKLTASTTTIHMVMSVPVNMPMIRTVLHRGPLCFSSTDFFPVSIIRHHIRSSRSAIRYPRYLNTGKPCGSRISVVNPSGLHTVDS